MKIFISIKKFFEREVLNGIERNRTIFASSTEQQFLLLLYILIKSGIFQIILFFNNSFVHIIIICV